MLSDLWDAIVNQVTSTDLTAFYDWVVEAAGTVEAFYAVLPAEWAAVLLGGTAVLIALRVLGR